MTIQEGTPIPFNKLKNRNEFITDFQRNMDIFGEVGKLQVHPDGMFLLRLSTSRLKSGVDMMYATQEGSFGRTTFVYVPGVSPEGWRNVGSSYGFDPRGQLDMLDATVTFVRLVHKKTKRGVDRDTLMNTLQPHVRDVVDAARATPGEYGAQIEALVKKLPRSLFPRQQTSPLLAA